jgi:hypothetical protein
MKIFLNLGIAAVFLSAFEISHQSYIYKRMHTVIKRMRWAQDNEGDFRFNVHSEQDKEDGKLCLKITKTGTMEEDFVDQEDMNEFENEMMLTNTENGDDKEHTRTITFVQK